MLDGVIKNEAWSKKDIDEMLTKLDYIKNQHRRKNIIIDGIADVMLLWDSATEKKTLEC